MQRADWASRWQEGRIAFHQPEVSGLLERHAEHVWGGGIGRVYVPLCGKSLDMVYLAERADEVLGVEYVEQALAEFFAERGVEAEVDSGPPIRYRAAGYTLFVADFFSVDNEQLGALDAVFDRAALVALDPETRIRYARHLGSLLSAGAKLLLITFDYDQTEMSGPPYAVPAEEVHALFGDSFEVEHLETRDVLGAPFRARGVTAMSESAFALTRI